MSRRRKKTEVPARSRRPRSAHSRQRQRLIDACISALHLYGPSRTTVEKVVAIAKMSPGIVRFYFDSKAAMLVASLQFLAAEFEQQVLVPVSKLKSRPVAALELLVSLYLDPDIASPRKVSVWYAFWGEASSRQEYYDICGQKDENFTVLVRELIGRLIDESARPELDPGGIALGLIGCLEMLWQDFAFQSEGNIDRQAAKARCMAYLRSVFPAQFRALPARPGEDAGVRADDAGSHRADPESTRTGAVGVPRVHLSDVHLRDAQDERLAGWVYANLSAFAMERDSLFQNAWQVVGHESQIPHAGDYFAIDTGSERVLVLRDAFGRTHALRNACPKLPHTLVEGGSGRFAGPIECEIHGLKFGWDGRQTEGAAPAPARCAGDAGLGFKDLHRLDLESVNGLLIVRSAKSPQGVPGDRAQQGKVPPGLALSGPPLGWPQSVSWDRALRGRVPSGLAPSGSPLDIGVDADWKLLVEQWLEEADSAPAAAADSAEWTLELPSSWSARQYRRLRSGDGGTWVHLFMPPNQLLETRPDGLSILQVTPTGPGRCRLRRFGFSLCEAPRGARAAQYLALRLSSQMRRPELLAESVQKGIVDFGYRAAHGIKVAPAVAWFRRELIARVPALGLDRPPS